MVRFGGIFQALVDIVRDILERDGGAHGVNLENQIGTIVVSGLGGVKGRIRSFAACCAPACRAGYPQARQRISLARRQRHISQASLAERMGASLSTVRPIEKGDVRVLIPFFARALHVFGEIQALERLLDTPNDDIGLTLMDEQLPKRVAASQVPRGLYEDRHSVDSPAGSARWVACSLKARWWTKRQRLETMGFSSRCICNTIAGRFLTNFEVVDEPRGHKNKDVGISCSDVVFRRLWRFWGRITFCTG
jgi:transcriptional regulator with XRE-family HTH domain